MTQEEEAVLLNRHEGRADVVINRPHRKNAINPATVVSLTDAFKSAEKDTSAHCVLLYGARGSFCSGIDMKDGGPGTEIAPLMRELHRFIATMRTPIVVAVERYAINGGSGLALACDLMVIGNGGFLQISEAAMGLLAPANVAWMTQKFGTATALRLTLSGERYSGSDLPSLGVPAKVVEDGMVLSTAQELADRIAAYPNGAGAAMKASILAAAAAASSGFNESFTAASGA